MTGSVKTAVLFIGLPYTGKTTLIQRLQETYPGQAIYADELFTRMTPASEISLARWFQEGARLVAEIEAILRASESDRFYIELGVMRAGPRAELIRWCRTRTYAVAPIWCQCGDGHALQQRRRDRVADVGEGGVRGATIDIRLDDLYRRICAGFEPPTPEEGFVEVDTCRPLDESLADIRQLLATVERGGAGRGVG